MEQLEVFEKDEFFVMRRNDDNGRATCDRIHGTSRERLKADENLDGECCCQENERRENDRE